MSFTTPDKNGWVSYGIQLKGKLYSILGIMKVEIESAAFTEGKKE